MGVYRTESRTELGNALDSKIIGLTSSLRADAKASLLVYVEDKEDIPFWRLLFRNIESRYSQIDITTLQERAANDMAEISAKGKVLHATGKDALMQVPGLGKHKVVAVDRDMDGLVANYHVYSNRVESDPYVISTTYYSIENHLLGISAVDAYLKRMVGASQDYTSDYSRQLAKYNDVLDPILPLMLAGYVHCKVANKPCAYSVNELCNDLNSLNDKNSEPEYEVCKASLANTVAKLSANFAQEAAAVMSELRSNGKYPDGLWKVVQGHTLFDFVNGYMHRVVRPIYKSREDEIKTRNAATPKRIGVEIRDLNRQMFAGYRNATRCIDNMMYDHPEIDFEDDGIVKIIRKIENIY